MKPGLPKIIFLLVLICLVASVNSQKVKLDSLYNLLRAAKTDTARARDYYYISQYWSKNNPDSALNYGWRSFNLFSSNNYTKGLADIELLRGRIYMNTAQFSEALKSYDAALDHYNKLSDDNGIAATYNGFGVTFGMQAKNEQALQYFLKALSIYEKIHSVSGMANTYIKIGVLQQNTFNTDKALNTYKKALKLADEAGDKKNAAYLYNNIGSIYGSKKDYAKALQALYMARQLSAEMGMIPSVAEADMNIANAHRELKNFDSSLYHFTLAAKSFEQLKNPEDLARLYDGMADLYYHTKDFSKAKKYLYLSNQCCEKISNYAIMLDNYQMLINMSRAKGNYKEASTYFDKVLALNESVYNAQKNSIIEKLKADYDDEKQQTEIEKLKKDNITKTKQRDTLAIGIAAGMLSFSLLAFAGWQIKRKNSLLQTQKKELEELHVVKDKFFSILSHDLRSPMASILGLLNIMTMTETTSEEENKMLLQRLSLSTSSVLETMDNMLAWAKNQIAHSTVIEKEVNLKDVADRVCRFLQQTAYNKSIKIENNINEPIVVKGDENQLEFVIRNLISNALKFSHENSHVELSAIAMKKQVNLYVKDYGMGIKKETQLSLFDLNKRESIKGTAGETGSGLGLALSNEFVALHKGKISVNSEEGKGTEFTIAIPVT